MIHNHEVPSSILGPATRNRALQTQCFFHLRAPPQPQTRRTAPQSGVQAGPSPLETCFHKDWGLTAKACEARAVLRVPQGNAGEQSETESHTGLLPGFLGYNAKGHQGLEGAAGD